MFQQYVDQNSPEEGRIQRVVDVGTKAVSYVTDWFVGGITVQPRPQDNTDLEYEKGFTTAMTHYCRPAATTGREGAPQARVRPRRVRGQGGATEE